MRLFVAVGVNSEVSRYLVELQRKISKVRCKVNWTEHFHITLKFLGERDDVDSVKEKLRQIKYEGFKVSINELGFFPETGHLRVLWVGTNMFSRLNELHDKIEIALEDYDGREFKSHITLGRIKFVKNRKDFVEYLGTINVENLSFPVDSFELYKSTLTPEGPVYEVVEEYVLG